jgi:hypothetical protein
MLICLLCQHVSAGLCVCVVLVCMLYWHICCAGVSVMVTSVCLEDLLCLRACLLCWYLSYWCFCCVVLSVVLARLLRGICVLDCVLSSGVSVMVLHVSCAVVMLYWRFSAESAVLLRISFIIFAVLAVVPVSCCCCVCCSCMCVCCAGVNILLAYVSMGLECLLY